MVKKWRTGFRLGLFDGEKPNKWSMLGIDDIHSKKHQALTLSAAEQSMTLLKNEKNILPLRLASLSNVAVIGPLANVTTVMMGGKTDYCPEHTVSLCEGITARAAAARVRVTCTDTGGGSSPDNDSSGGVSGDDDDASLSAAVAAAVHGMDAVVLAVGGIFGHEAADRTEITLPEDQIRLINATIASAAAASTPLVYAYIYIYIYIYIETR